MDIKTFRQQCIELADKQVCKGVEFPHKTVARFAYATAWLMADGSAMVELDDFGGCSGYGKTVADAYQDACITRILRHEEVVA